MLHVFIVVLAPPLCQGSASIDQLEDFKPYIRTRDVVPLVTRYMDGSGKERIKGNTNLKKSQSYPIGLLVNTDCLFLLVDVKIVIPFHIIMIQHV